MPSPDDLLLIYREAVSDEWNEHSGPQTKLLALLGSLIEQNGELLKRIEILEKAIAPKTAASATLESVA